MLVNSRLPGIKCIVGADTPQVTEAEAAWARASAAVLMQHHPPRHCIFRGAVVPCPSQPLESPILPDGATLSSPSFLGRSGYLWVSALAALSRLAAFLDNPELNVAAF